MATIVTGIEERILLEIKGHVPSKKNSKRRVQRGAHVFMIPSAAHEVWHADAMMQVRYQYSNTKGAVLVARSVQIEFFARDKRGNDLSNKAESIMDLLVDAGILADDNWHVVPILGLIYRGVDKANPRALITIKV